MKIKSIVCVLSVFALCMGCSDKKDVPQSQQQVNVSETKTSEKKISKAKKYKIPLDSSRIVTLKDFDPNDSISVGVRAFRAARKEFVKRWNYTKDTELFMDVVDKICLESRLCAAMMDSVAYKNDVAFILDSLMRNNLLDKAIEARKQEIHERENGCLGKKYNTIECHKKRNEEMKKHVMEELKRRKGKQENH